MDSDPTSVPTRKRAGNLLMENIPEIPERVKERLFPYQNIRAAYVTGWSDAGLLITTRFGDTMQVFQVERPGGSRRQLTYFTEPIFGAYVCPDPHRKGFLFLKDVGGGEFYQIYYFDLQAGRYSLVTDGHSRNGNVIWAKTGDRFAYSSTRRNGRDYDLYISEIDKPTEAKMILQGEGFLILLDWSYDGKRLIVGRFISATEVYCSVLDLDTGELVPIGDHSRSVAIMAACFTADGAGVYLTSNEDSEFQTLRYYDLADEIFRNLTDDIHWNVEEIELSPDGNSLAFTVNEDGMGKLYFVDTVSHERQSVELVPSGQISGLHFHPNGAALALSLDASVSPSDAYVLKFSDGTLERWTTSETGGLPETAFVSPELIRYKTFDSEGDRPRLIPSFYYRPRDVREPSPVIIHIHGGPESQYVPVFYPVVQYFANELGLAVLAPNVRGSAGYGKTNILLDNGYQREDSVRDIGALLDWIEEQPELDAGRVALWGGSYGGYMVLASMIHYGDRIRCGIETVGISNFVTFLENTQAYRRDLRRSEYGDERDPAMRKFLLEISPTTNAHRINKPLFVIQGKNDPRVPVGESEQIVAAVRRNQTDVWYMLAEDEGHGLKKRRNIDYSMNAMTLFLERYLL